MPNKLKYNVRFFRCYNCWAYKRDYDDYRIKIENPVWFLGFHSAQQIRQYLKFKVNNPSKVFEGINTKPIRQNELFEKEAQFNKNIQNIEKRKKYFLMRYKRMCQYYGLIIESDGFLRLTDVMNADKDQYIDMNIKQLEE